MTRICFPCRVSDKFHPFGPEWLHRGGPYITQGLFSEKIVKKTSLTRRSFVLMASAVPFATLKAEANTIYVCTPCGLSCDKLEYEKPGTCPVCGMALIVKSAGAPAALTGARFPEGQSFVQFPFELLANSIFLPVDVNGKGPYLFALDTGSFNSIIASEFVQDLGIQTRGKGQAMGAGSDSSPMAMIDNVTFSLPQGAVMSTKLAASVSMAGLWPLIGRAFYGDLGHDVLQHFVVQIDYENKVISLFDPGTYRYAGHGTSYSVNLWGHYDPQIIGEIVVPGQAPIRVMLTIDTGAGGTVLSTPLVNAHHIIESVGKTLRMPDHGIGNGESQPLVARLKALRVGSYLVEAPLVALSQDTVGSFTSQTISVNIGGNILRRFTVILDYPNGRVILEPNRHFSEPFASDASGLVLKADGADFRTFVVQDVVPDSPAAEAGVMQGDIITAIDATPTSHYSLWQLQDVLKDAGRTATVTIQRSHAFMTLKLALRALV